jgi:hypothetical protein
MAVGDRSCDRGANAGAQAADVSRRCGTTSWTTLLRVPRPLSAMPKCSPGPMTRSGRFSQSSTMPRACFTRRPRSLRTQDRRRKRGSKPAESKSGSARRSDARASRSSSGLTDHHGRLEREISPCSGQARRRTSGNRRACTGHSGASSAVPTESPTPLLRGHRAARRARRFRHVRTRPPPSRGELARLRHSVSPAHAQLTARGWLTGTTHETVYGSRRRRLRLSGLRTCSLPPLPLPPRPCTRPCTQLRTFVRTEVTF